ncbi:zona pellucida sperm-binding protein 3 [Amia ocellicauda]|uniref:zona pellucida sperm-binding protein 3 n=1 Tax=Amia ocellicauda TaxID=2972642 RepID=UPI0034640B0D
MLRARVSWCGLLVLCVVAGLCDAGRVSKWARAKPAVRGKPAARAKPVARAKAVVRVNSSLFKQQVSPVVWAQCGESAIQVSVERDLFGTGRLIQAADIQLGGCALSGQNDTVLVFQSELQGCGSALSMTEDELVYSFSLNYNPSPIANTGIVRTDPAVVHIECVYLRLHNVSSDALQPTWVPYTSTKSAEDLLDFSLQLMTDDWSTPRPSNVYFLGDILNIQASVNQASHVPLRLFVDSCVATLTSDPTSSPSYTFIGNYGCLIDAKVTGSSSHFMPRPQDVTKLQLVLDAFRFHNEANSSIYLTCHLKVTAASQAVDNLDKACQPVGNSWSSVDGSDQVCSCCDSSCNPLSGSRLIGRFGRDLAFKEEWEGDAMVSVRVLEKPQDAVPPVETNAQRSPLTAEDGKAAGISAEVVLLAGVVAAVAVLCIAVLGTVLYRRASPPTA